MRKALIKYRGKRTQVTMGKLFGVSQQTWSCWETGQSTPPAKVMQRIAKKSRKPLKVLFPDVFN